MITLNGNKFAENEDEFLDSLFTKKTCSGYAKRYKRHIRIYNAQKEQVARINRWGVICQATKLACGNYLYSYGVPKEIGEYQSHLQYKNEVEKLAVKIEPTANFLEYNHWYK